MFKTFLSIRVYVPSSQCAKFHFWVTPDFLTKSGVTFNKKIGIGIGSENREWLLQEVRQDIDMLRE